MPEISELIEKGDYVGAYNLARRVEEYIPNDPELERLKGNSSLPGSIETRPSGATVYVKGYTDVSGPWEYLGRSPLGPMWIPFGALRWRITDPGFKTLEIGQLSPARGTLNFTLDPEGTIPPDMVHVPPGGTFSLIRGSPAPLQDYLIDKYEVTNREFKEFVNSGGYRNSKYWKEEFVKDGRALPWSQAMALLTDKTGRLGPSTWELGDYPPGEGDYPISGVSWYEAAAYAVFAGKSLPTVYHWQRAAGFSVLSIFADILWLSNFGGKGPARVGSYPGIGPYGTYDMAGNVKEWCWNETTDHRRRYILGGAWNEPVYMFRNEDALSPFDRSPTNGFRCVKYLGESRLPETLTGSVERLSRDFNKEKPVSYEVFRIYNGLYSYDRTPLNPVIESKDTRPEYWIKERISYAAAYGNERIPAYLFVPKNAHPPYQAVVYFPHVGAFTTKSSAHLEMRFLDFIVRSGRALLFPVYKGTYERLVSGTQGPQSTRDLRIEDVKDLERSVDYLETRPDIDHDRLAYYGISLGSALAPIILVVEHRFKAAVLVAGGFSPTEPRVPEVAPLNFAPHVGTPVLMLNGRYDFIVPVDTCQDPMFRLLGTPAKDKRHILYDTGHVPPRTEIIKETLNWLDRYLGLVK